MKLYWRLKRNGRWTWEAARVDSRWESKANTNKLDWKGNPRPAYWIYRIRKHEGETDECR